MSKKKILAILAHPDDETLGFGGTLARYAAEGVETHLICATRGQRGWLGAIDEYPGPDALGAIRAEELKKAAQVLNIKNVRLLDYMDGALDSVPPEEIVPRIVKEIQRIRPQIVLTFDPYGVYGHPDHIAISQFATTAIVGAAGAPANGVLPHRVDALFYRVMTDSEVAAYQSAFGELVMNVDGVERRANPWPEWSVTHRIDTVDYVPQVWEAVRAYRSQLAGYERLLALPPAEQRAIFGTQTFYRAFSFASAERTQATELLPQESLAPLAG